MKMQLQSKVHCATRGDDAQSQMRANPMRIPVLLLAFACSASLLCSQAAPASSQMQAAPTTPAPGVANTTAANAQAAMAPVANASALLKPALAQSLSTLSTLKVDKWKKGS